MQPDLIRVIFIATEIAAKLFASVRALKVWLVAGLSESMVEVVWHKEAFVCAGCETGTLECGS